MSTPPPLSAGPSTRQQLDELDALLQRMLALPLNQYDEPPTTSSPQTHATASVPPPPPVPRPPLPPDPMAGWTPVPPPPPEAVSGRPTPRPWFEAGPPTMPSRPVFESAPAPVPPPRPAADYSAVPVPPRPLPEAPGPRTDPIASLPGGSSVFAAWGVRDLSPEARRTLTPQDIAPGGHPELGRPISTQAPSLDTPAAPLLAPTPDPLAGTGLTGFHASRIEPPMPVPVPVPEPVAPIVPEPVAFVPAPEPVRPRYRPAEEPEAEESLGLLWWPAFALNWLVFGLLYWFGPPGRWLGSVGGRQTLGAVGVLCGLAAIAWGVIDWLGWQG